MVAITLIGILAAGIIVVVNPVAQLQKANDAKRKSDLGQLQRVLETYYNDNGRYPVTCGAHQIERLSDNVCLVWGVEWETYMSALPKDPKSGNKYVFHTPSDGQSYRLYASLERGTSDPQVCNGGAACAGLSGIPGGPSCGTGAICNYGVTSPNISP